MKVVVVTGGIGSGKSLVCRYLMSRGIPVYDSDSRVKTLYTRRPDLAAMVTDDIFTAPGKLEDLENALYPVLMDDFREWAASSGSDFVAFESAVVLQKSFFDDFGDYVLWIDAPFSLRKQRVRLRGNVTERSLQERVALQTDCRSNPRVDMVLENDGSEKELYVKVDEFLDKINYGKREN